MYPSQAITPLTTFSAKRPGQACTHSGRTGAKPCSRLRRR